MTLDSPTVGSSVVAVSYERGTPVLEESNHGLGGGSMSEGKMSSSMVGPPEDPSCRTYAPPPKTLHVGRMGSPLGPYM